MARRSAKWWRIWLALYLQRRRRNRDVETHKVEVGKMALLKLDGTEKYIERNAITTISLKNATSTTVNFKLGQKVVIAASYETVKTALENPDFIPIWSALVDIPALANNSLDPRQVAAVIEKNATSCFLYLQDGSRLTLSETAANVAASLGYVA